MDSSEFLNFLATRVSVREYEEGCITEDDASYLLTAASKAPSAGNLEAWDVVIVTDPGQLEMLADAAGNQHQIKDAGCVFCVCANYVRAMSRYGERGIMFAVEDATIAATYMMLAAHARRLHTCWVGAFPRTHPTSSTALCRPRGGSVTRTRTHGPGRPCSL